MNMTLSQKIRATVILAHLLCVYWLATQFSGMVLLYGYISWFVISKLGFDIGYHRYFCHKSFQTSRFIEVVMLTCGTLLGLGSSVVWCGVHRMHHDKVDSLADPHSPANLGIFKTWFTMWGEIEQIKVGYVRDLIRDPLHVFYNKYYFYIVWSYLLLLTAISILTNSITPIIVMWVIPVVFTFHIAGFADSICHKYGYRNYDTNDKSTNNLWLHWTLSAGGLHNNHHAAPGSYTFNTKKIWYEFDLTAWIIRHFLMRKKR